MGSDILLLVTNCDDDALELRAAADGTCTVLAASDGAQSLQLARQSPCLIVVSDRFSGWQALCGDMRADASGVIAPLVVLADADVSAGSVGADGRIARPVDRAVLGAWLQATRQIVVPRQRDAACVSAAMQDREQLLHSFARLSHAVNNPLQALYATVDMLLLKPGISDEAALLASEVITHAGRVAQLVAEASSEAKQALETEMPESRTQAP